MNISIGKPAVQVMEVFADRTVELCYHEFSIVDGCLEHREGGKHRATVRPEHVADYVNQTRAAQEALIKPEGYEFDEMGILVPYTPPPKKISAPGMRTKKKH